MVTDPSRVLELGSRASLPCSYPNEISVVIWYKGDVTTTEGKLVFLNVENGERSGDGYADGAGRFDLTDDYALIIENVTTEDEGKFICQVSDTSAGATRENYTVVTVIGEYIHVLEKRRIPFSPMIIIVTCNINLI